MLYHIRDESNNSVSTAVTLRSHSLSRDHVQTTYSYRETLGNRLCSLSRLSTVSHAILAQLSQNLIYNVFYFL